MEQIQGKVTAGINEQGVCFLTFSYPPHNALSGYLLQDLSAAVEKAGADRNVKVIVLGSGGDRTFCAGASFEELKAIRNQEEGYRFFSGFAQVINACRKCPKLIIGRVQGKAIGGGVGIAAATDYCFATRHAAVRLSELALGIGPFVIGPAVERRIGPAAFSQLALLPAEWKSATWAAEKGFYAEVFPDNATMDEAIEKYASDLTSYNQAAMQTLKQTLWEGTEHWDELLARRAAISGELVLGSRFSRDFL